LGAVLGVGGAPSDDYRFSVGKLPAWAKKQVENDGGSGSGAVKSGGVDLPKGGKTFLF